MRISSNGRTWESINRWERPCTPAPMIASTRASTRANNRVESAAAPAVRSAVMAVPIHDRERSPACGINIQIRAWWVGRPSSPLPGNTLTELDGDFLIALIRGHGEQEAGGGNRDADAVRRVDETRAQCLESLAQCCQESFRVQQPLDLL